MSGSQPSWAWVSTTGTPANSIFALYTTQGNPEPGTAWINIAGVTPAPQVGWATQSLTNVVWYNPYAPPPPTLLQQAQNLQNAGVAVISPSMGFAPPGVVFPVGTNNADLLLNGNWQMMLAQYNALQASNQQTFLDGTTTALVWNNSSSQHYLTPAQFTSLMNGLMKYCVQIEKWYAAMVVNPQQTAVPQPSGTIFLP